MDNPQFQDRELKCLLCGEPFIWTSGEQVFITDLCQKGKLDEKRQDGSIRTGKVVEPKRCKDCRMKKKLGYTSFKK